MASQHKVLKVFETHQISPPHGSVPKTSLPLTFFDIPWLLFSPSQPLFFYELSHSTHHFTTTILPNLTHSLSLTLQHFFPLAGKLSAPPPPTKPHLTYADGDSVTLTVAESAADFRHLSGHHHRDVSEFHHLVPGLLSSVPSDPDGHPLLAVQITAFPQCGICVGFTFRHVAADGRTFDNFLKSWASINRMSPHMDKLLPVWDRSRIKDLSGLEPILLNEWWKLKSQHKVVMDTNGVVCEDMVRATFVVGQPDMEKINQQILLRSEELFGSCQLLLTPYVLTCALLWVYLIKARGIQIENESESEELHYFGFIAGGITRLDFPVPAMYLGNCVGFGRSVLTRSHLLGEDGIIFAAKAIGDTIKKLNGAVLGDGEKWISDLEELIGGSDVHVMVTGSPKVNLYGLDFGWGRPKKIEEISIDKTRAVSLTASREMKGGIEVGLALPKAKMDAFGSLFNEGLNGLF